MLNLTINGQAVTAREGMTILAAASKAGFKIPTLCFLRGANAIGSCRICSVELEGQDALVTACNTQVQDGMHILTDSPRVIAQRKGILQLLIADHGLSTTDFCFSCAKNGACQLQDLCRDYGVTETPYPRAEKNEPILDSNPFLSYNANLCIRCQRCIGACNKLACNHTLRAGNRGMRTTILAPFGKDWKTTMCESCGNCAQACPTGALTVKRRRHYRAWETHRVRTTCPHCGTGCQLDLIVKDNQIVDVEGAKGPSNNGLTCVKGRSGSFDFIDAPDRLRTPMIRSKQTGELEPASWDEALDLVASKFSELKATYGGSALAAFACSRSTNEDVYMLQKMARVAFGTNNVDNCARVCHSSTVSGLAITLGSGAMTNTIADITRDAETIMLVGSNIEEAHPVIGMQVRQAVERGARLIVVDPRDIWLSSKADIHLKLRPGTNVAFANGMAHVIIEKGLADQQFIEQRTEGYEKLAELVKDYTPERVAKICHIDADDLVAAAEMYARAKTAPIIYCLGVTEHSTGTEGVMGLSNLAMLTGKLGRKGCGVNPIRGQNNVQGACDMGAQPVDFPGYQKLVRPEVMEKFEKAWGVTLPKEPGITATECFPAAIEGKIKGMFIFGEDPVRTDADTHHIIRALENLEFLVIDDLFLTETTKYADVVLPGRSFAEKEGTFTNTERRVQRVRKAIEVAGDEKLDTWIFTQIMNRMGYAQPELTSAQIMDEIASVTPSFAGISHARLDSKEVRGNGLQWPCTGPDHPGTPIMHVGEFARGKGLFSAAEYRPSAELPDAEYPLVLTTGRIINQYNACAMTARTEGLNEIQGTSFIEINTQDAQQRGIADGDRVRVWSRRGQIESTARVSGKTCAGETWMPFHFQDGNSNWLTNPALDDISHAPEYKVCAIQVAKL